MDNLLPVLGVLFLWRAIGATGVAVFAAWVISLVAPGTPVGVSYGLVLVGLAVGVFWQAKFVAARPARQSLSLTTSTPVAVLGIATYGGLLAAGSAAAFNSWLFGALVCIGSTFLAGAWCIWLQKAPVTRPHMTLVLAFLIGGVCGLLVVEWLHA